MRALDRVKPIFLTIAIALGVVAEYGTARADPLQTALVAGGCFWCVEHDLEQVPGVREAVSGFAGGSVANPTYKQVVRGGTGHREVVQITFDPAQVSYGQLIGLFLRSIDPTDAGGQFCDRGATYTTAIYALDADQAAIARQAIAEAKAELGRDIVTPVEQAAPFYPAEAYHQDYAKSRDIVLTRFGPLSKAKAYKRYRTACGRDARVRELWGDAAPFVGG